MYNFIKSAINNLGVGTANKAFQRPRPVAVDSIYGPAYNIQGQLVTVRQGAMMINKSVVIVGITGNGSNINRSAILSPLAEESE